MRIQVKSMVHIRCWLLLLVTLVCSSVIAKPNEPEALPVTLASQNQSKPAELTIAFTTNVPPFMGVSPAGNPQGLLIDIWRLWSETVGIKVKFIPETMLNALKIVEKGQADIKLAYPYNAQSNTDLIPAMHIYSSFSQVFVAKNFGQINDIDDLAGHKVAMFDTSPYLAAFRQSYPEIDIIFATSYDNMIDLAEQGKVQAMISEVESMKVKLVHGNLQSSFYQLDDVRYSVKLFSLVNSENTQLVNIIQEGFKQIPLAKLQQVEQNWLPENQRAYFTNLANKINLSAEENAYLQSKKQVVLGVTKDWVPFEFVNQQGQVSGIIKDMAELVFERLDKPLKIVAYDNFMALYQAIEKGDVDIIAGLNETEKRREVFKFTEAFMEVPWAILHTRTLGSHYSLKEFYGKRLALIKGYQIVSFFREQHPQIDVIYVDTVEQGELAVRRGLADGFIEILPVVSNLALKKELAPLAVSIIDELPIDQLAFSSHLDNEVLINIVDKVIKNTDKKSIEQILNRWFEVNIQTGLDKRFVLKISALIGSVIVIIIAVIAFWNIRLVKEIKLRKKLEVQMKYMATHDELTGTANRSLFMQQLEKSIAIHQRQQLKLAVMFIDLDGFKLVNDNFGHDSGDQVIIEVAKRLKLSVRASDIVARFGGDEFVILVTGLSAKKEVTYVADKVIREINRPYSVAGNEVNIGCSIGIAVSPDDAQAPQELLKLADNLMYRVKTKSKNSYYII